MAKEQKTISNQFNAMLDEASTELNVVLTQKQMMADAIHCGLMGENHKAQDKVFNLPIEKISMSPIGSRETCCPAPTDTDEDWLVLTKDADDTREAMEEAGFTCDGSPDFYTGSNEGGFISYRQGELNVITTQSVEFYHKFLSASMIAKKFNMTEKEDRITVFQAVLYNVSYDNLRK